MMMKRGILFFAVIWLVASSFVIVTGGEKGDEKKVEASLFYDAPYPAHSIYGTWDKVHPWHYSDSLSQNDSTLTLLLADTAYNCNFHFPVGPRTLERYQGKVTSKFGWRDGKHHRGVDMELHKWDSILTIFPGVVRIAKKYGGYGNVVVVRHYNGLETLYAHMSVLNVKTGQVVEAGDLVGKGGNTGNVTGVHLHMEIRFKGVAIDPTHIINFKKRELETTVATIEKTSRGYIVYPYGMKKYTTRRGDYISKVARRFGITSDELCAMNGITRKTRLHVGDELLIFE